MIGREVSLGRFVDGEAKVPETRYLCGPCRSSYVVATASRSSPSCRVVDRQATGLYEAKKAQVSRRYGVFFDGWLSYMRESEEDAQVQVILLFMTITHEGEHSERTRGQTSTRTRSPRARGEQQPASQGRNKRSKGLLGAGGTGRSHPC